jgi:glycosyltransferase involved in cell wall biosynthesis
MQRDLLYSGFRWPHHDKNSGYDKVVASQADFVDGNKLPWGDAPIGTLRRRLNFLLIDIVTILRSVRYSHVLLFYPEQTAYFSPIVLRALGKKVTCVLHLGADYWFESGASPALLLKRANVRWAWRLIVLSRAQRDFYAKEFRGEVSWIPHGIWCDERPVDPVSVSDKTNTICVVGDTYRDYDLLVKIVQLAEQALPAVKFELIGVQREKLSAIAHNQNVLFHKRLSAEEYRQTIERSLFVLLPLRFATANNALLEGMSFGVPVYCSDVEGVADYIANDEYVFESADDVLKIIRARLNRSREENLEERNMLKQYARDRFGWERIRSEVASYATAEV